MIGEGAKHGSALPICRHPADMATEIPSSPLSCPAKSPWLATNNAFSFHSLSCRLRSVSRLAQSLR